MASQVLVAMDTSDVARQALRHTLETHPDADITVLTVVGEPSTMFGEATAIALADDAEESAIEYAKPVLSRARKIAAEYETEIDMAISAGHPAQEIIDQAPEYDTVVVGSHSGSWTDRLLVGNVAKKVSRESPVPVTIVR